MEAEQILNACHNKVVTESGLASIHTTNFPEAYRAQAIEAMKEAADKAWDAGSDRSIIKGSSAYFIRKETFMKELFKDRG